MSFDYGNVLTRAFQITWKHKSFWLFMMFPMLAASMMFIAFAIPLFLLEGNEDRMGLVIALWSGVVLLGILASWLLSTAGMASLTLGVLRTERAEGSTSFMDLVRDGFQYFGRVLGVTLIIQLSIGAVFTVFFLCVAALTAVTMGIAAICLQPIMILLTPLSFLVSAMMTGGIVSVMDEGLGAWEAVKRAFHIVREHVWKFIILTMIVYFGSSMIASVLMVPAMLPAMAAPVTIELGEEFFMGTILLFMCMFFPLMAIFSGIVGTFMTSAVGISYLRLSRRSETEVIFAADQPKNATS